MGLFSRKPAYCTICNKQITAHKYKAKREWYGVKSPLCSDCHLDKMQEHYDATLIKKCMTCGVNTIQRITGKSKENCVKIVGMNKKLNWIKNDILQKISM